MVESTCAARAPGSPACACLNASTLARTTAGVTYARVAGIDYPAFDGVKAVQLGHPLVCVNVVGGGYDFAAVKPFLAALSSELHEHELAALRSELKSSSSGPAGPGQLAASLSTEVPNAISVFFNPSAGHSMADAAIRDILDKLGRTDELKKRGSIQVAVKTAPTTVSERKR